LEFYALAVIISDACSYFKLAARSKDRESSTVQNYYISSSYNGVYIWTDSKTHFRHCVILCALKWRNFRMSNNRPNIKLT